MTAPRSPEALRTFVDRCLAERAARPTMDDAHVVRLAEDLTSEQSLAQLAVSPYWPKWNSPWWKMLLLFELGKASAIPAVAVEALAVRIEETCLTFFPPGERPPRKDVDPARNVPCHCQLGSVYRVLHGVGFPVDERFPWMRPWFLRYQLPDGGLNCDDDAYSRETPRSSFLSTLPCLEAVIESRRPEALTADEVTFLDGGARYLLARRLCRSLSKQGRIIDETWLRPAFPRFYFYDVLRGLRFLVAWALATMAPLSAEAIGESLHALAHSTGRDGYLPCRPHPFEEEGTLLIGDGGSRRWEDRASTFPLLDRVRDGSRPSAALTAEWHALLENLARLSAEGPGFTN